MAASSGGEEGSVLFDLGETVQADRAVGGLGIAGGGGRRRRLSEVNNVLVGCTGAGRDWSPAAPDSLGN